MKKFLWLLVFVSAIILFEQCSKDGCGDPPPYFLVKNMKIFHGAEDLRLGQVKKKESADITVDTAEKYRIFCDFDVEYTTNAKPHISTMIFNSAYATEPCPTAGEWGPKYPLTDIRITSNADFDSVHPKGSLINRYFREPYRFSVTDSLQASDIKHLWKYFSISCIERPKLDLKHNFKIELTFSNGDKFWGETAAVTFIRK